ncbi:MAG: methionyl-tRNA formyltransferase [Betaproteobacteria bacterium]
MRIVLIGQQDFGKAALEAFLARGDEVVGVFCRPEKPGTKPDALRVEAQARGLQVFQLDKLTGEDAHQAMQSLAPDLGVMAYVVQFAPQSLLNVPKHGTIQYHPSLLPKYRGPSAISWAMSRGEKETGLTIFRPSDGLDEGLVILQKRCDIGADETLGELYFNKLFPLGVSALLEAADAVAAGTHHESAQDESQASYEGWFLAAESQIHWNNHIDVVYDLIRACNPAPGAWTLAEGKKVFIFDCRKHRIGRYGDSKGKPAEITAVTESSIWVSTQSGQIEVLKLRADDGKKMGAGDYARAQGLIVGTRLG